MTDIRELLREATADVKGERTDLVRQIRRAVSRRRRRAAAVGLAVIAVAVAIIVPLSLSMGNSAKEAASLPHRAAIKVWAPQDGDVVAYAGSLWGLKCCSVQTGQSWVDKLDPNTGQLLARFKIPAPAFRIAAGAGRIWVTGFNPGGGGPAEVTAIDPATGSQESRDLGPRGEPHDIAFADGSAWITQPLLQRVLRLTPPATDLIASATGFGRASVAIAGGPETIAATSNGQLWVQRLDDGELSEIRATHHGGRVVHSVHGSGRLFGSGGNEQLLYGLRPNVVKSTNPLDLERCLHEFCAYKRNFAVKGAVIAALATPRGTYVASARRVWFFSASANQTRSIAASASSLAPDREGVVIGTDAGLVHWVPAG